MHDEDRSRCPAGKVKIWGLRTVRSRPEVSHFTRALPTRTPCALRYLSTHSLTATMEDPPLASLSLTHVHYDPNDLISLVCAFLALVPQGLTITYVTLIWSTREVEILLMFAGQMGCEALNWILKRWIQEERPTRAFPSIYSLYLFQQD